MPKTRSPARSARCPRDVLREIHAIVAGRRPLTAALGDAAGEAAIERAARTFAAAGAALVKVGFAGIDCARSRRDAHRGGGAGCDGGERRERRRGRRRVCRRGPRGKPRACRSRRGGGARRGGGCAARHGGQVRTRPPSSCVEPRALAAWVTDAHDAGLLVALAGKLTADDLTFVRDTGADIAGVRGAACDGGRTGRVTADRVRLLRTYVSGFRACEESL